MAKATLKLVESDKVIEKRINKSLASEINKALDKASTKLIVPVKTLVKDAIFNQPEVFSLSGGKLAAEFGLPDGRRRISDIIDVWVNGLIVTKKKAVPKQGQLTAGLTIKMIPRDFADVLRLPQGTIVTEKGQELPWLEWLIKFGDRTIVKDYSVNFDRNKSRRSRSGFAIMQGSKGSTWKVPPEFAGTEENNFVTRALKTIDEDLMLLIEKQLKSVI